MTKRLLAVGIVAAFLLGGAALYVVGWQLSRPVPDVVGPPPSELQAAAITFDSDSGSKIRGWLSRGSPGRGAVLLLPGIRANRLSMVERAMFLRRAGYSTLLIDFQATGESPGDAITFGWRERLDVVAAVRALKRNLPGEPIGVIGISLGGAATLLAAPALDIQAAILESVYPSIDAAVRNRLRMRFGSIGAALAPLLLVQLRPRLDLSVDDLVPADNIAQLRCPVLIIGGLDDAHTTASDTQRLFAAAVEPKQLWLIPRAAHVDFHRFAEEEYQARTLGFLNRALHQ
jgi:alpha-beta hydrolase superfamily lysophospholipase